MKRLQILLLVFMSTICNAQVVEEHIDGRFRVVVDENAWKKTDITADKETRYYTGFFPKAIKNPGVPILVERFSMTLKLKPLFKKLIEVEESFIVYDDVSKKINYLGTEKKHEHTDSFLLLPGLIATLLMSIVVILHGYEKNTSISTFWAVVAVIFLTLIAFVSASSNFHLASFLAIFALIFAIDVFRSISRNRHFKRAVFVYYILMASYFVCLFIGL